jgi:glutamate formiminotransferase/formiminotetrahydrofolate cyclodeaminase
MKIVECVPNFSVGRDGEVIGRIADAIRGVQGALLLDVSPGIDTNRTVYTFAGEPSAVLTAACSAVETGLQLIDMSTHSGTHPRLGACDVCPFVPVSGVNMDDCIALACALGERVGHKLHIPVYLYAEAAKVHERRALERIRAGEYEGLEAKLRDPGWRPDYGPAEYTERVRRSGALITGAREFLIAYNVNLNTQDRSVAARLAGEIREKGESEAERRGRTGGWSGSVNAGLKRLRFCRAIGWYIAEYGKAQVSMNLTNYRVTNMHHAFETVRERALGAGVEVTGSEIVGLVPKAAIIESGMFYLGEKHGGTIDEERIIEVAVESLGLNDVVSFRPQEKVVEYCIKRVRKN